MAQRIDYTTTPCRVTFSLPTRSKRMIDDLADLTFGSVQRFGRVVFMEGMKKLYPDHYQALLDMDDDEQMFFPDLASLDVQLRIQSELSSLRSEVAALRATITMTTQTGEDQ